MGWKIHPKPAAGVWTLAEQQHGVVARSQLAALGLSARSVERRLRSGRLHEVRLLGGELLRGVYAVGRPGLTRSGLWMASVLACGDAAVLSHSSAAALYGIRRGGEPSIEVSVRDRRALRRRGLAIHRPLKLRPSDVDSHDGIPVTTPARTLIDLATMVDRRRLEAAVNAADKLDLVDPETLRDELEARPGQPGVPALRDLLDIHTFRLTDSELERRFLRLVRRARLSLPETGVFLNGCRVDFFWPDLSLVVETDGLRYHRTAAQQSKDLARDAAHAGAGLTALRFSHRQVRHAPHEVIHALRPFAVSDESPTLRGGQFIRNRG